MKRYTAKFFSLLAALLLATAGIFAQADQESPWQVNETATKGEEGLGSTIWIIAGILLLLVVFLLLRKSGKRPTRAGNPK